jgi:hypothetical protein
MTFPEHLRAVLSPSLRAVWDRLTSVAPPQAYLVGGTAVAAHLGHRSSQDLDFFLEQPVDLDRLERSLGRVGTFAVTARNERTLNCVIESTVVGFLDASDQRLVEPTVEVAGLRVAGIGDLLATKLHAVTARPALRDYVDLQAIEERANRYVEEGLALFVERYRPRVPDEAVAAVVRALASFDDIAQDPGLEVNVEDVARYWGGRVREITRHLDRWG